MMMSYKAAAVLKQKSRTAKTILFHFGLFLASIVIITSDTDFVTFGANNQVRNFWLSDFESIADKGWFIFFRQSDWSFENSIRDPDGT